MKIFYSITVVLYLTISTSWANSTLHLSGNNDHLKCGFRNALAKEATGHFDLGKELKNMSLSPECLTKEQQDFINETSKDVRGFFFGTHLGASSVLGVEGGLELVITVYDEATLMLGVVSYVGGGISVGLPFGASLTTGVLHGNCKTIESYLGHFQNFSLLGFNKSFGTDNELTEFEFTECDSSSNTDGLSLALLGYSMSNYKKFSEFYFLKGNRVHDLIEFITRHHPLN